MINLNKIKELYIACNPFDLLNESNLKELDYKKWELYVSNSDVLIWYEETDSGKKILSQIDSIPDDFKNSYLSLFNKTSCYADFNHEKKIYNIGVIFHKQLKYIVISFERKVNSVDLRFFLYMANYLDAYLLNHGNEIIDEKVIERLE